MDIYNVIIVRNWVLVHFCRRHGFSCAGNRSAVALRRAPAPRLDDGREVILENPRNTGTLRAAQVELPVRDGRNIRMPINVIPIRSGDAEVNSVTVTMQDLAPPVELERLRAEYPGMPCCVSTAANGRQSALQPRKRLPPLHGSIQK